MLLVGLPAVLVGWIAGLNLLADGLRLLRARHRLAGQPGVTALVRGVVSLVGAAWLAVLPWIAAVLAEASTGWHDPDGDGMLGATVNGSYDWVDVNGGPWGVRVVVLVLASLAAFAGLRRFLGGPSAVAHGSGDAVDGLP